MSDERLPKLIAAIRASQNYGAVSQTLIESVGEAELNKRSSLKEAIKSTKNKLHQVGGAYLDQEPPYGQWIENLRAVQGDPSAVRALCLEYMAKHASTRERLPILETFYSTLFNLLPPIRRIVDLACGLNPLALPWMPLPAGASYRAYDIYRDMTDFADGLIHLWGMDGGGFCRDILNDPPANQADLTLLLKAIPCLEQISKDAGKHLLDSIHSPWLIVSFPITSLGGKEKGMRAHYEAHFEALTAGRGWALQKVSFTTELVFVVRTNDGALAES